MQTTTLKDVDVHEDVNIDNENNTEGLGKEEQKSRFIHLRAKGKLSHGGALPWRGRRPIRTSVPLGNQDVFQLLKEVTLRRILTFCSSW
jgi:hypothetical protein